MDYPSITSPKRKEHLPRLDVIRACAFLLVFCFHFGAGLPDFKAPWNGNVIDYSAWTPSSWPLLWMNWGYLGVALFFVLSGFCIHLSFLHQAKPFTLADFYWRRFLRIYPPYLIALLICFALMPFLSSPYQHPYQLLPHLLLIHNWFKCTFLGVNGVFWSLGVEAQFYLLYPLLLRFRQRFGITGCFIASLVLNLLIQIYFTRTRTVIDAAVSTTWGFPLVTWCDWILGACLAEAFVEGRAVFRHNAFFICISFLFLGLALNYKPVSVQSFLFSSVFFAAVMERYLNWKSSITRLERLLVPVGLVSYSLYLWHAPVLDLWMRYGPRLGLPLNSLTHLSVYLPLCVASIVPIVVASYYWIELGVPRYFRGLKAAKVERSGLQNSGPA